MTTGYIRSVGTSPKLTMLDVIKLLTDLKNSLHQELKNLYSKLHSLGTRVPLLGFMDFPKSTNLMSLSDP